MKSKLSKEVQAVISDALEHYRDHLAEAINDADKRKELCEPDRKSWQSLLNNAEFARKVWSDVESVEVTFK